MASQLCYYIKKNDGKLSSLVDPDGPLLATGIIGPYPISNCLVNSFTL
jgi:hypothetical protein